MKRLLQTAAPRTVKNLSILASITLSTSSLTAQTPEERLAKNGINLPTVPAALGNYVNSINSGHILYLSGKGPMQADYTYAVGKLGRELSTAQGYVAARLCAIAQIAVLKEALGDLSKVKRILHVSGFVNCNDSFTEQPEVINGYSDMMFEVFGAVGVHTRSAVGVASLPGGWPVEVEMIVEVTE